MEGIARASNKLKKSLVICYGEGYNHGSLKNGVIQKHPAVFVGRRIVLYTEFIQPDNRLHKRIFMKTMDYNIVTKMHKRWKKD